MAKEIERKYLVIGDEWRHDAVGIIYRQGYLSTSKEHIVRVRTVANKGLLTIKGANIGAVRTEFEYEIPFDDAITILETLCEKPLIEKMRHKIIHQGHIWEVDEFKGENIGLILAEIELLDENETFEKPEWIGEEVTDVPRFYNSNLVQNPFTKWGGG